VAVRDRLGGDAMILDTERFPEALRISLGAHPDQITIDGKPLRPSAAYVRSYGLNPLSEDELGGEGWRVAMVALRERSEMVHSMVRRWEDLGVAIYNPPSTRERITKPYQLGLLAAAGLPVPDTLWTNDADEVRRFAANRRVVYKPVVGGAKTRELAARDFDRFDLLASAPVCFQELLPGEDVRVYVVDNEIACATRIESDEIDFRGSEKALHDYPVDEELRDICIRATRTLGLRFTGMDLKADAAGKLKILELNASPMFLGLDARAGTDVVGALCRGLRSHG
jgi:glutathione synthase/RimK-type ligase-like ATP-grasp enzyme